MLLVPDPTRFWVDPFCDEPTICLIANVVDPITKEGYGLDPRSVAIRAESYLRFTGVADTSISDRRPNFSSSTKSRFTTINGRPAITIDSEEAHWNSGRRGGEMAPNSGFHIRAKEGYVPVRPVDTMIDLRNSISLLLGEVGVNVECHHHEVATAGQCEIDFKFSNLLHTADNLMLFKYIVKNAAVRMAKRRRSCQSRSTETMALACTVTSRSGRTAIRSFGATSTPDCRRWRSSTSAAL